MGSLCAKPVTVSPSQNRIDMGGATGNAVGRTNDKMKILEGGMSQVIESPSMIMNGDEVFWGLDVKWDDVKKERVLGQGSFGQVSRAHYMGKRIACKRVFLPYDRMKRQDALEDFQKELQILSMLKHPNIVRFFGAVQDPKPPGFYAILTELLEGSVVDLLVMVKRKKINVTWGMAIQLALDCARALAYLHGLTPQILHRDLKAENLLITKDFHAKISDFGLSRILNDPGAEKHMTLCGTPSWIAPEIFRGEAYSWAVDVYSYAVVIWELVNFKKPYGDQDRFKVPYLVSCKGLRPTLPQHMCPYLTKIMTDCWRGDSHARPAMSRVVERLERAHEHVDLHAVVDPKLVWREPEPTAGGGRK